MNLGGVLHPIDFLSEIGSEGAHYRGGHFGSEGSSPAFNATWLWRSFGLALPLAACALLTRSADVRRAALVLLSFIISYYVFLSAFPVRFARNLLPVSGTIAAAAAIGLIVCAERLVELGPPAAWVGCLAVLAVATLAVPVTGAAAAIRSTDEDPWTDVNTWLDDHVPAGSTIATEAFTPYVDNLRFEVVDGAHPCWERPVAASPSSTGEVSTTSSRRQRCSNRFSTIPTGTPRPRGLPPDPQRGLHPLRGQRRRPPARGDEGAAGAP